MTASVYLPTPEGFCFGVKRLYSHQSSSVTGASRVTAAIFHIVSCRFPLILQRNGHLNLIPTFFFFSLSFLSNFGYQGVLRILQYCLGWFRMFWNFHFLVFIHSHRNTLQSFQPLANRYPLLSLRCFMEILARVESFSAGIKY